MNIIFHVPKIVDPGAHSGFHVRVPAMLRAFTSIGCTVTFISGTAAERKLAIEDIKQRVRAGEKFDFLYAENATIPTLLTESHHFPTHPFLDYGFFRFCAKHSIPAGLFYRDIYWRFPEFRKKMGFINRQVSRVFQYFDLFVYKLYMKTIFLPSKLMAEYVPVIAKAVTMPLPPGIGSFIGNGDSGEHIRLFYVGGISSFYNLENLFKTVHALDFVELTVCCRPADWNREKHRYSSYLNDRIQVVHASGEGLAEYFSTSDIGCLFLEPQEWRDFAMPIKLFEYLQNGLPVIATKNTSAGSFIEDNGIGWTVEYSVPALTGLLQRLQANNNELTSVRLHLEQAAKKNTWEARARTVAETLAGRSP